MSQEHLYQLTLSWTGNKGEGTRDYVSYERSHEITIEGKPLLAGSSDPQFRGDTSRWNPEELLVASLSSCHMLWYLHLCSMRKIIVVNYQDTPKMSILFEPTGEGKITEVMLRPHVTITQPEKIEEAKRLHEQAHKKCVIATAFTFQVALNPEIDAKS